MSEKVEKPTAKKLRDARAKGQVAKSVEITSGVQLAVMLGYFTFEGAPLLESFEALLDATINAINLDLASAIDQLSGLFASIVLRFVGGIAALVIVMTIVAVIAQIGPLLAPETVTHFFYLIRQYAPSIQFLPLCGVACGLAVSTQLLYWMWVALIGFYVMFGIADFAFQRYNTNQQLMMSLEDIKQEFKNSEGNPEMKQKRKEVHREVQSGSLAANVAKSTAVVRNPTHIAVCLYFRPGETPLPQVIEIGHDEVALHIVVLAEKAGIAVVENIAVARALAARTEVGRYIPAELFEPVAHILRIAMKLDYDNEEQ
ncbi:Type III secretion inner membrane protein (YscU,SpaS,EscU,HrcU,SsaU) [Pseudomonas chlororaphis]|uniref:Type III secretion inner membrane protein (YscU,SpaS,EscU,HrcU,SsaU) n=1 Tax=Pseudomonas chlororaphis TaxID=587753 RepID=A0A3G7TMI8_9PSED|nr:EscU/YscU/HrcU family type III secretion system export apparatus switch protein [Pseudomonas chlororaphis]AZE48327.1 Type III secretion inner membrane protein (YscU,SpaS,EscU,HrcU,SsaU) [Pseudomonas chlororaphis]